MNIPGYIYVRHSIQPRNMGSAKNPRIIYECSFAVDTLSGQRYDGVITVSSLEIADAELSALIVERMDAILAPDPAQPTEQVEIKAQDGEVTTFEVPL